jgi:hypothetical protein
MPSGAVLRPLRGFALRLQQLLDRFALALGRPFLVLPGRLLCLLRTIRTTIDLSLTRNRPGKAQDSERESRNSFHHASKLPKLPRLLAPLLPSVFHNVLATASIAIRGSFSYTR